MGEGAGASEMSQSESSKKHAFKQNFPFIIAIFRGIFAIFLGIFLFINPNKSQGILFNFMGAFWLTSGFLLLSHRNADEAYRALGKRTSIIVGLVGIGTGLLVLMRGITQQWLDRALVVQILGVVILLTGLLHLTGEVRISRVRKSGQTVAQFILGVFEVILGAMLLFSPLTHGPLTYLAATIWALVGGMTIIGTAVYDRFKADNQKKESAQT